MLTPAASASCWYPSPPSWSPAFACTSSRSCCTSVIAAPTPSLLRAVRQGRRNGLVSAWVTDHRLRPQRLRALRRHHRWQQARMGGGGEGRRRGPPRWSMAASRQPGRLLSNSGRRKSPRETACRVDAKNRPVFTRCFSSKRQQATVCKRAKNPIHFCLFFWVDRNRAAESRSLSPVPG